MTTFNTHQKNAFHYLTMVAFRRTKLFELDELCQIFADTLKNTKEKNPFKLIGYVIMPDHVHLIVNPLDCDISALGKSLKGVSARKMIDWLKGNHEDKLLNQITLAITQKRSHQYAAWLKRIRSIDLWSGKFIRQKLNYVHMNPVRAGYCQHPADWKWSSYRAYFPHQPGHVPIEVDWQGYWPEE